MIFCLKRVKPCAKTIEDHLPRCTNHSTFWYHRACTNSSEAWQQWARPLRQRETPFTTLQRFASCRPPSGRVLTCTRSGARDSDSSICPALPGANTSSKNLISLSIPFNRSSNNSLWRWWLQRPSSKVSSPYFSLSRKIHHRGLRLLLKMKRGNKHRK